MELFLADIRHITLQMADQISQQRAEKVKKLRQTDDKKRCIAGGLLINKFLQGAKISLNNYGKPVADNGMCFNISHSGNYVLFALSEVDVGCDIQNLKYLQADKMAKVVFCENEISMLDKSADKIGTFHNLWTKKESLLKCMGDGFHRNSKSTDVSKNTFAENGIVYYMKTWNFSDYTVSVCSLKNSFPDVINFIDLGDAKNE